MNKTLRDQTPLVLPAGLCPDGELLTRWIIHQIKNMSGNDLERLYNWLKDARGWPLLNAKS